MSEQIMNSGKTLREFQQSEEVNVFQDATELPDFFRQNLVDEARVIKHFENDPQGNLRVFYYQYLKLCFEFDNPNSEHYTNKIYELISRPEFVFSFPRDAQGQFYNDKQFKRLLIEFMDFMGQGGITVNRALSILPIMDFVFVCFFRSFLLLTGKATSFESFIDREPLFEFLTGQFNVEATVHQNCMKFVDTDIFAYQENPYQVFMVYIDYEKNIQHNVSYESQVYSQNVPNNMLSAQFQKLPQGEMYVSRDASESRDYSSVVQSQENSVLTTGNHNEMFFKANNNYANTVLANKDNDQNSYAKRKEMLSYMGSSQIYDFVDYTNPSKIQKPKQAVVNEVAQKTEFDFEIQKRYTEIQKLQDLVSQDQRRRNEQPSSQSSRMQTSIMNNKSLSAKKDSVKFAPDVIQYGASTNSINQIQSYKNTNTQQERTQIVAQNQQKSQFQGTFNAKTNPKDTLVSSFQETSKIYQNPTLGQQQGKVQTGTKAKYEEHKFQYLQNDKYGLDSVVPNLNSLTAKSPTNSGLFGGNNFTGFPTSPTNSSISTYVNSNLKYENPTIFASQSFEEKMKRMTNNQLGPDHNSKLSPTNITNDAYLNREGRQESKSKTINLDYVERTETKVNAYTYDNKFNGSLPVRSTSINPDQEFTDSFTLQNVNEPQRSSIKQMKIRARTQRKSVGGGFI